MLRVRSSHKNTTKQGVQRVQGTIFTLVRLFFTSLAATSLKLSAFLFRSSVTLLVGTGREVMEVEFQGCLASCFWSPVLSCLSPVLFRFGGCEGSRGHRSCWEPQRSAPWAPWVPRLLGWAPRRCRSFSQPSCEASVKNGKLKSSQ